MEDKSIYQVVREGYGEYQQFVNDGKYIPNVDGLKSVHRRYLLSVRDIAKSRFQKSAMVLGNAMGKWHPHEIQEDTLYSMVRWGLVEGQGNFGMTSTYRNSASAAIRYTEVKYNNKLDNLLFKFEDYFLKSEGENGFSEPEFLITPIPVALLRGTIGIGVGGVRTKIPGFTYKSILEAYEKDDPSCLQSAYGLDIDYEQSNLKSLWNIGHGKLVFKFQVSVGVDNSVELYGDASFVKPDISQLIKWEKEGLITISDRSTDRMRLVFTRNSNIRRVTDKMILDEVNKASVIDDMRSTYIIMFSHKGQVIKMGIKGWLDLTINLYKSTFNKWQSLEIKKNERAIDKLKLIPEVSKMLQDGKTTAQIAKELSKTRKLISSIEGLPLRMLRKSDFSSNIKRLEDKITSIKNTKVESLIESGSIVDNLIGFY